MRREQKTRTEYLLWLLADEDNSYLAERLGEKQNATKQSASESASSQNDWTRRRISSLLYFSGFQSQRVAFSHYQPAYAYASTAYQSEMQSTTSYTQPMVYEPSV